MTYAVEDHKTETLVYISRSLHKCVKQARAYAYGEGRFPGDNEYVELFKERPGRFCIRKYYTAKELKTFPPEIQAQMKPHRMKRKSGYIYPSVTEEPILVYGLHEAWDKGLD